MRVKFLDGTVKECAAPTELKLFKTSDGELIGGGWLLTLKLIGGLTAADVDSIFSPDNIKELEFSATDENGNEKILFCLSGYERLTSSAVHYSEDFTDTFAEIQLSKGV